MSLTQSLVDDNSKPSKAVGNISVDIRLNWCKAATMLLANTKDSYTISIFNSHRAKYTVTHISQNYATCLIH